MELLRFILISSIVSISLQGFSLNLTTTKNLNGERRFEHTTTKNHQVFYFWATWCPDCKEKMSQDLSKYETSNVSFLTVSTDKDSQKAIDFLSKKPLPYLVLHDEEKVLQKQFKVFTVPTVVLAKKTKDGFEPLQTWTGKDWSQLDSQLKALIK